MAFQVLVWAAVKALPCSSRTPTFENNYLSIISFRITQEDNMNIQGMSALVTGGGSGLGEATARELARLGAKVAVLDLNLDNAQKVAADIGGIAIQCDVTNAASMENAVAEAAKAHGGARILMQIAGIGTAKRIVGKDGNPAPLEDFAKVVNVNLIGTYNAARVFAAACAKLDPMEDGERGAMVFTASVAAFDGQVGQQAYSASKAGVAGMTLPMARDLAQHGIRVCTIAPGIFATPLLKTLPEPVQASLAASIPFPSRLGKPEEFAQLAAHIVSNGHLNGEVIRLDGALRMAPR
jgi:NAD(P)-dependent dehydrogenase (short-subunit alcohol dehydrogenase family)